jgi:uncharacterized protein YrrD
MLNSVKKFRGFTVAGLDGEVGTIKDVYFDDEKWAIRYLVVDTGGWFSGHKVLISPFSVISADWEGQGVRLNLTKEQIKNAPGIDADKPVSRQHETDLLNHYGYPYYWAGPMTWGYVPYPNMVPLDQPHHGDSPEAELLQQERDQADPHLRSAKEVIGYEIQATDDSVGAVEDFMFESEDWSIQLMVVDTGNWLPGKKVLISPRRIDDVDWAAAKVFVNVTRDRVEESPEFDSANPPSGESRQDLYRTISGSFY